MTPAGGHSTTIDTVTSAAIRWISRRVRRRQDLHVRAHLAEQLRRGLGGEELPPRLPEMQQPEEPPFCHLGDGECAVGHRGINPTEIDLDVIDGTPWFALHYLAGQRYAINHGTSLKRAFLRIGPWTTLRVNDINDVAHFFNLSIHTADVDID